VTARKELSAARAAVYNGHKEQLKMHADMSALQGELEAKKLELEAAKGQCQTLINTLKELGMYQPVSHNINKRLKYTLARLHGGSVRRSSTHSRS
jgi:hypothetical protein